MTQIKRSAGQSAIAAAAYRAGEKLHSEYYGEDADYTKKSGVICSEILLPPHAPPEYADRQTLWNAVEKVERHPKAQLAYSFDIALQNEFSLAENIDLARQFLLEHFVSRGMVVDFAVHDPDKRDGGISNPHFHVMCPIRPLEQEGGWGAKQRRAYVLDEDGKRVRDEAGNYVFNAVPTTDWGSPETLEHWRQMWAEMCNAKFEEKGLLCRIDHRSYERQGLDLLPTIHEGPAVRQMEAKGIPTDKGDLNRWIKRMNALRKSIRAMLAELAGKLREIKSALSAPREPSLVELVTDYYSGRNAAAWSLTARLGNLKSMNQLVNYILAHKLYSVDDLEARVSAQEQRLAAKTESGKVTEARLKELTALLRHAQHYAETKPVYDEWYKIKFDGRKAKFKAAHEDDFKKYYAAARRLKPYFKDGKLPLSAWRAEVTELEARYAREQAELTSLKDDVRNLRQITLSVTGAIESKRQTEYSRQKHHNAELE